MFIHKMQSIKTLKWMMYAGLLFFSQQAIADQIKAIPWVKMNTETAQVTHICQALKISCTNNAEVWKKKTIKDNHLYLIDKTPQLIEFVKENNQYVMLNSWNFKHYQHHSKSPMDEVLSSDGIRIYPAFYPLNRQKFAIAVVKRWSVSYSGGGRLEEIADFVMLEPNGVYKLALADTPFHSYERIRACFSQEEYESSTDCHDESSSNLSIEFKNIGKTYYQWILNYNDLSWEAF